jgi:Stress responsive A/B Barrel Domain
MILHVAIFRLREDVTEAEVSAVAEELAALKGTISALQNYYVGPDAGLRAGNGDFGVVAQVADEDGLIAYLEDPEHVKVASKLRALAVERTAVQIRAG